MLMPVTKADIIAQLQRAIMPLQGFRSTLHGSAATVDLGAVNDSFPNNIFPTGAVHEFFCHQPEDIAVTTGFIAGIMAALMKNNGAVLWISASRKVFPPALLSFGINPDKIIFIDLQREKDVLWCMEEALKCDSLVGVVGEMQEITFTASRRLQLAVEQSRVTGFIVRSTPRNLSTACIARWKITSIPSKLEDDMPGVGFPGWNVELIKVRNGKPGSWQLEWVAKQFRHVATPKPGYEEQRKAG